MPLDRNLPWHAQPLTKAEREELIATSRAMGISYTELLHRRMIGWRDDGRGVLPPATPATPKRERLEVARETDTDEPRRRR